MSMRFGLLVAMHPSSEPDQNAVLLDTVRSHRYPTVADVTFIDKHGPLKEPIDTLVRAGVEAIALVPLYPSVKNVEVRAFFYRLGLVPSPMSYYDDSDAVDVPLPLRIGNPFGGDRLLAQMHLDLGLEQAANPSKEAFLLLYHGALPGYPDNPEDVGYFQDFVGTLREISPFARVETAHVYPRSDITTTARRLADEFEHVIAVPYFVGRSRFTSRILPNYLKRADRPNIRYSGNTILFHPRLGEYITNRYREVAEGGVDRVPDIQAYAAVTDKKLRQKEKAAMAAAE